MTLPTATTVRKQNVSKSTPAGSRAALRDGGAMGISVAVVGLFGFFSWSLTARLADPVLVGTASSLINAVLLTSAVGQLQLGSVILRWLPEAGRQRGVLLRRSYAAVAAFCVPAAIIVSFALPAKVVSSRYDYIIFGLAVIIWALFSLQDQVLAGLWKASVIPLENGAYVVLRLALVAPLIRFGDFGVLAAWIVPALVLLVIVSCFMPRLLRRAAVENPVVGRLPTKSELVSFVAGNWAASLAQLAVWNGLPILVTSMAGSFQGGVFFIVWSIIISVELAANGFVHAVVVRAGGDRARLGELTRTTAIWFGAVFTPSMVILFLLARPILSVFGATYAQSGTAALQLLALGVICRLAPAIAIGVAQVRQDSMIVFGLQGGFSALLLGAAFLVSAMGSRSTYLVNVSTAYLVVSAAICVAAVIYLVSRDKKMNVRPHITAVITACSLAAWQAGASLTAADNVGLLGLFDALHPLVMIGVALLVIAFVWEIRQPTFRPVWGYGLTALLAVQTYGIQPLVYGEAKLPVGWLHAGWSNYVASTGTLVKAFDARFSWPGFFEVVAMISRGAGLDSTVPLLRWAPVVFILAWLVPMALIARSMQLPTRLTLVMLWIFLAGNWVEQEYFSPQAMAFLLYLMIVALCARMFCRPQRHLASPAFAGGHGRSSRERVATVPIVVLAVLALAPSHQLTPYFLIATLAVLTLGASLRPRMILLIALLAPVGWLVLGAHDFWSGHSEMITQDVGAIGQVVDANVANRIDGSAERTWAQLARLLLICSIMILAMFGIRNMWHRRRRSIYLAAGLAFVPVTLIFVQSYGGEMLLRVWLFSLPWLALLAAYGFAGALRVEVAPNSVYSIRKNRTPPRLVALSITLYLAVSLGLFSRSSNDGFNRISPGQVAAMDRVYASMRPGEHLAVISSFLPWKFTSITDIQHFSVSDRCSDAVSLARCVMAASPDVVVVTASQQIYGELVQSYPPGFSRDVIGQLLNTRRFRIDTDQRGVTVLRAHEPSVLAMGDSITRGDADPAHGIDGTRAWPTLVKQIPDLHLGPVRNAGVQGNWTEHIRSRLPERLAMTQPDFVVILGGTNDVWQKARVTTASGNIAAMVSQVQSANAIPILVTIPPQEHADRDSTSQVAAMNSQITAMNQAITQVAMNTKVPVVDAHKILTGADGRWREGLTIDGVHPSPQGAQILAKLIGEELKALTTPANVAPFGPVHRTSLNAALGDRNAR